MDFINYLIVSFSLFFFGIFGVFLNRKNIILILMCIELMLLSVNLVLLVISIFIDDCFGQIFSVFILTIAASESSIGLAILIVYFRINGTVTIERTALIKG
jgi:NADH-quinone oxidoreductase subunit K